MDMMEINIKEFVKLSEREIQADLHELFHFNDDSDCSVQSSEVLNSFYPVKPRKSQKKETDFKYEDLNANGRELNNDLVDEALAFIKAVQSNRKEIFDAEQQREELESLIKSLETHTSHCSGFYNQSKGEVDAYFRILQGVFIRSLKAVFHNKNFFRALEKIQVSLDRKDPFFESTVPNESGGFRPFCVKLVFNGKEKCIFIRAGLTLFTPYGIGKITDISTDLMHATLDLPFGKLHSSLVQVLSWVCKAEVEEYTNGFLVPQQNFNISELFSFPSADETPAIDESRKEFRETPKEVEAETESVETEEQNEIQESTEVPSDKENSRTVKELLHGSNRLFQSSVKSMRDSFAQKLLLGLAPKDSLSHLCKNFDSYPLGMSGSENIDFDFTALLSQSHGRSGNHEYDLSATDVSRVVEQQNIAMKSLFDKQRFLIEKLEKVRHEGAKLSSLISNIRLAMFTRRIAHRNLLQSKGIPTNLFATTGTRIPLRPANVLNNSRNAVEQRLEFPQSKGSNKMTRMKAKDMDAEPEDAIKPEEKYDVAVDSNKKRVREDEKDSDNESLVDDSTAGGKRKSRRKRY